MQTVKCSLYAPCGLTAGGRLLFLLFLLWGNIYHVPGKVQSALSFKHLPCPVRRCFCIPTRLVSGAGGDFKPKLWLQNLPPHHCPRWPLLIKGKLPPWKTMCLIFHISFMTRWRLRSTFPVVLTSVYTHLQPRGSSLGPAVLHSPAASPFWDRLEEGRKFEGEN